MLLKGFPRKDGLFKSLFAAQVGGWRGYALAVGITLVAALIRLAIAPLVGDQAVFAVFIPAALFAALAAGPGPGVLCVILSILFTMVELPRTSPLPPGLIGIDFVLGLLVAWIGSALRYSRFEVISARYDASIQKEQMGMLLRSVPDAVIIIDAGGGIASFNAVAEDWFGYREAEVVGRDFGLLIPDPFAASQGAFEQCAQIEMTGGNDRTVDARRADGSRFPVRLSLGRMATRGRTYFVAFVRDLTEREEHRASLSQLQNTVARLSRLQELGEMASTLAHELNQPLSAIASFAQGSLRILRDMDHEAAGRLRGPLEEMARQAVRAGRIIHHVREAATHQATEMNYESLRAIIEESVSLAVAGGAAKSVEILYRYNAGADRVFVDRVQIQQVLINLMRNAFDAMSAAGRGRLTISTSMQDAAIAVDVADSGPGVSEEVASRLFKPFVTTKASGMGIGLSISRRIAEAHDGTLQLIQNSGDGATFRITLPVAVETAG